MRGRPRRLEARSLGVGGTEWLPVDGLLLPLEPGPGGGAVRLLLRISRCGNVRCELVSNSLESRSCSRRRFTWSSTTAKDNSGVGLFSCVNGSGLRLVGCGIFGGSLEGPEGFDG